MKKTMLALLCVLCFVFPAIADNPELLTMEGPVLLTGFGQSQDTNSLNIIMRRLKLDYDYLLDTPAADVQWDKYKAMFAVLGCSSSVYCCSFDADSTAFVVTRDGKQSPTVSGLSLLDEEARNNAFVEEARKRGMKILALHIGGEPRRLQNSQTFLPFAGKADYMIVRADGNLDGYFTKVCAENNVPLYTIQKTAELRKLIPAILGK